MNFGIYYVVTPNPNFVNFGVTSINATYRLGSVSAATTRVVIPTNISYWILHGHDIEEATADRVSKTKENSDYIFKNWF